jgi:hypothetical protein
MVLNIDFLTSSTLQWALPHRSYKVPKKNGHLYVDTPLSEFSACNSLAGVCGRVLCVIISYRTLHIFTSKPNSKFGCILNRTTTNNSKHQQLWCPRRRRLASWHQTLTLSTSTAAVLSISSSAQAVARHVRRLT